MIKGIKRHLQGTRFLMTRINQMIPSKAWDFWRCPGAQIEVMLGRIKDWRRIYARYHRCAQTFMTGIALGTAVLFWINKWVLSLVYAATEPRGEL